MIVAFLPWQVYAGGGGSAIVKEAVAGVGSALPTPSVARTAKVCAPVASVRRS